VYLNFNTPQQRALDRLSLSEAKRYLAEGHFSEGSMAPKIRAAIHFVENRGKDTIITHTDRLGTDGGGTRIVFV